MTGSLQVGGAVTMASSQINGGTTALYRCSGGTNDGAVVVNPSTQATACTTGVGTLVSLSSQVP
jgi:hypothetical protein